MVESTKSVLEFLEQLRGEREELDLLIAGLERRLGIAPRAEGTPGDAGDAVPATPRVKVSIDSIPVGFFHNLSQPQATEKLLRLNPGHPLTTKEILEAFRKSGMTISPKNAVPILYTALSRSPKFERVAGKAWGLAEWYPERRKADLNLKRQGDESPLGYDQTRIPVAVGQAAATQPARSAPERPKKDLLSDFIRQHGPQTRKQLLENAGLKPGTLATCLNDKTRFRQLEDGRWDLVV